ncbi:hypothetical protein SLS54_007548 [Diplodia seriata]
MPALPSSPDAAPAQPVRSALAHPETSVEATFGLIFQSHDRRYDAQDALPPGSSAGSSPRHSAAGVAALKRRSNPQRPPRPTSAALQGAQAYLGATLKPSTMRLQDVEAWVEDSLHAQAIYDLAAHSTLDIPAANADQLSSPDWPAFDSPEPRMRSEDEPLQRMKSPSFSSSLGKKLARSPSDLMTWLRTPSVQDSGFRSRSISQTTDPRDEEQLVPHDRRWSASSRRRALRLSDSSQRALPAPTTPPSYRSVLNGLHRRFYSNDDSSDSDSSWTSFGCVDGMKRPDLDMNAEQDADKSKLDRGVRRGKGRSSLLKGASIVFDDCAASLANRTENAEPGEDEDDSNLLYESSAAEENRAMKDALKRIASRFEVPIRQTRPYMESDTACMMPY